MADGDAQAAGMVFDIQRFSLHDGPGIRTTVFLKGCPLRCRWCHNPESLSAQQELFFSPDRCVGCGQCVEACPHGAHRVSDGRHELDRAACRVCGRCADACPAEAVELVPADAGMTAAAVMAEVLKDAEFYLDSGGGMTLSGGEPAYQPGFATALLRLAREAGVPTAVETSGWGPPDFFRAILPLTDLFLFDLKADAARHCELTGVPLAPVVEALRFLAAGGARIWLRLPLVPGLNDTPEHLQAAVELARSLPAVEQIAVIPYHSLGRSKYPSLGLVEPPGDMHVPDASTIQNWLTQLDRPGVREVVLLSG